MARTRKTYTKEFKLEAVRLVTAKGLSFSDAASELKLAEVTLRRWVKELESHGAAAFPGNGVPLEEEVVRLRRELAVVKVERDLLKKATIFFAQQQG